MSVELHLMDLMEIVKQHEYKDNIGEGGVMFGASIGSIKIIGSFIIYDGLKLNAQNYCYIFDKTFFE